MNNRKNSHFMQLALWGCMLLIISTAILTVLYTNLTLHAIEKDLPTTLLAEMNMLSTAHESIVEVVSATRIARITETTEDITELKNRLELSRQRIIELRDTYVLDNLVNASSFHAVVAPAVADLQIWLTRGLSGYGPDSPITLTLAEQRIVEAAAKAGAIKHASQQNGQAILNNQLNRLERFQFSVTLLFVATALVVTCMLLLLVYQTVLHKRSVKTAETLREQRDLLNSLLQNLPLGIAVWNQNNRLLQLNHRFTEMTGYHQEDLAELGNWPHLAYPDSNYRQQVREDWRQAVKAGIPGQYLVTCKQGDVKEIEIRAAFLPDGRVINTLMDVTERNRTERALQERQQIEARAKKMQSLGLLAGGVAHDLNNILSGIVSYPELLLLDLPADAPLRKPIETIRQSGMRAAAIVQDLLTVARGVAVVKEAVDMNALIQDYLQSPDFGQLVSRYPGITVTTTLANTLPPVKGSPVHLRKILMNLTINAFEAIESTGKVHISTATSFLETPPEGYPQIAAGQYIELSVTDDGSGIDKEDLERIFEPFYSKKVIGRSGTGLGLAVVWNVVEDHHGIIAASSSAGGSCFTTLLPATHYNEQKRCDSETLSEFSGSGETILVVDDVATQRQMTCEILEKIGYRAESVASGEAAIEFLANRRVDLIILDMIMDPGMNGRQTLEHILAMYPGQKAIIVSGFAETEDVKQALRLGAAFFLTKPLSINELGVTIHRVLKDFPEFPTAANQD